MEAETLESEAAVERFESHYGMSLSRFETEMLPTLDTLQAHEDYNDWFFWQSVLTEKRSLLAKLGAVRQRIAEVCSK